MTEENDDKAVSPKNVKVESGDMNVESQANEANDKKAIASEDKKLETGDMVMTVEASDSNMYQRNMEPDIVDEEETEQLKESNDSSIKEEGDCLGSNIDIEDDLLVQNILTKETDIATGQLKKKLSLVVVGSNHKFNVRSRYLSDSIGSCHDFCKFGHKHQSEKITRRMSLGTIRESQRIKKTTYDDLEKCGLEKVTQKNELCRRLSLPGPIPQKAPLRHLENKNLPRKCVNQSKMKHVQSETKSSPFQSPKTSSRNKTNTQAVKKTVSHSPNVQKTSTQKLEEGKTRKAVGSCNMGKMEVSEKELVGSFSETSLNKEAGYCEGVNEIIEKEPMNKSPKTSSKKEAGYSKGLKEIKAKKSVGNSPKTPLNKSPSMKARLYKNRKSCSNSQNQFNSGEPEVDGHDDTIEPNANVEPLEKISDATISVENSQHSPQEARGRKPHGSKGNRKGNGASLLSFSSLESSKPHGKKHCSEVTKNKQIGFETEESGSKTSTPRAKSTVTHSLKILDFKNTKQNDITREDNQFRTSTPREKSMSRSSTSREKFTVDQKWKPKSKEKSNVEENDASAWKVKFKKGTVVALQVANNAPKRLRFRRARSLSEGQIQAEINQKLKNAHEMGNETHNKVGPEKVRLRHQEASEKKDDVDLNNVIEETASKLVKTRKSKVKALVGAFETVMSFNDRKLWLKLVRPDLTC